MNSYLGAICCCNDYFYSQIKRILLFLFFWQEFSPEIPWCNRVLPVLKGDYLRNKHWYYSNIMLKLYDKNIFRSKCKMQIYIRNYSYMVSTRNVSWLLPLSLLGYLKTRICWGGLIWPPPSKSHVWCSNMTNYTSLESSCALLLESAKKFANLQNLNFLLQNPVI